MIQGNYTTHYLSGTGDSNIQQAQPVPFRVDGSNWIYANLLVGGVYTDVALSNNEFTNIYCIQIPTMADAESQKYRLIWQVDQAIYSSQAAARASQISNLNLGEVSGLSNEIVVAFKLIVQAKNANATSGHVQIMEVVYYTGGRATQLGVSTTPPATNNNYALGDLTLDHTGFADNENIDVAYDVNARTVTLTHPS